MQWRPEEEFFERFHQARPAILGALLDAVATGLRNVAAIEFSGAVRMADFARWTQAAEPALGLNRGAFMHAYLGNRAEAVEITLDASPLTEPLRQMAMEGFEGIATELLKRLTDLVDEKITHSEAWPRSARGLSGDLRRLAPVLRRVGVEIDFPRSSDRGRRRLILIRTGTFTTVHYRPHRPN